MQKSERRQRVKIITNAEPIRASDLPSFKIDRANLAQAPQKEIPTFNIPNMEAPKQVASETPARLDFNVERNKEQQRKNIEDHIKREEVAREAAALEQINSSEEIVVNEARVTEEVASDGKYVYDRVYLPSQGLLNSGYLIMRPFDTAEIMKLHKVRSGKNRTSLFDVINLTIKDFDVRDLVLGDFQFVFYWLKMNSFTRNSFTVRWQSKYGNDNKSSLKLSDLTIKPLKMDPDDVKYYTDKGFCIPTLRDGEEFERYQKAIKDEETKENVEYSFSYAQFLQGSSVEEKLEKLKAIPPDDLVEILEFSQLLDFGVSERMTVKDKSFNPDAALEYLNKTLAELNDIDISEIDRDDIPEIVSNSRKEIMAEITRINHELQTTGEAAASSETIEFKLGLDDFFPENIVRISPVR